MQITLEALGTRWWITLPKGTETVVIEDMKNTIREFEENYSRFKTTSLIGQLNENKILKNPPEELLNMFKYALDVYTATDGIFNISIGSELEKKGYGVKIDKSSKVSDELVKDIDLSETQIKIQNYMRLDFGGFGKGWLIEKLSGLLKHHGVKNFVINGGGDIVVSGKPETIYIGHPTDESMQIGEITLSNQALASSSNLKRTWTHKGKKQAHIISPDEKYTYDVLSVHVLAKNILFADTFATVFLLVPRAIRLELSNRYNLEFMEILSDMTTFKTNGFDIKLNY